VILVTSTNIIASSDETAASRMHAVIRSQANRHPLIIIGIASTNTVLINPAAKSMSTDLRPQLQNVVACATPAAAQMNA
jgi:polysaccharide pyruvyl transferase WcaK-like protein